MAHGKLARLLLTGLFAASSMLLLTNLTSCTKDSTAGVPLGEQELPDMVLNEARYTLGRPGEAALVMTAKTMTVYKGSKGTILEDVTFRQDAKETATEEEGPAIDESENGEADKARSGIEGSCRTATIDEDGEKATLTGDVVIHSYDNDLTIMADSVEWDNGAMTIQTTGKVYIEYGDGTRIAAEGFSAILDEDDFEFGRITEGTVQ